MKIRISATTEAVYARKKTGGFTRIAPAARLRGNWDMRFVGIALAALLGSFSVITVGYAGTSWLVQSELSRAATTVSTKATKKDRLGTASPRYATAASK